jgi:tetratricopeptide (TPR) repeat protein
MTWSDLEAPARAFALAAEGRPRDARVHSARALELLARGRVPNPVQLAGALRVHARIEFILGDHAEAARHYAKAIAVLAADPAPQSERERILNQAGLANTLRVRGRYAEAVRLYRAAAGRAEQLDGDPLDLAAVLNGWGIVHKYTGEFDEAERLYGRALRIVEAAVGVDHLDAAGIFHNLGGLAHARGDYVAAEPLARRAVELRRRALHHNHPDVAADEAALAAILDRLGKRHEAEKLLRRALEIFEHVFGPCHYKVAINLNNLAAIVQHRGEPAAAEALYRRAPAIQETPARTEPPRGRNDSEQPRYRAARPAPLRRGRSRLSAKPGDPPPDARDGPPNHACMSRELHSAAVQCRVRKAVLR